MTVLKQYDSSSSSWKPVAVGADVSTTLTTKGDILTRTATAATRQPVGADGQMLYADSTQTNGIKWAAAPASGSMTLLSTTTLSGASTTISGFSSSYKNLIIEAVGVTCGTAGALRIAPNNNTTAANQSGTKYNSLAQSINASYIHPWAALSNALNNSENKSTIIIYDYAKATEYINFDSRSILFDGTVYPSVFMGGGLVLNNVTSLVFNHSSGANFTGGTVRLYGVN